MRSDHIINGFLWRFGERICAQIVSFVVTVILARILLPSEYGIIALTSVFITVCNVFVTSGFGTALIQKRQADDLDFTTILLFGFCTSCLLYGVICFASPGIAGFFHEPLLSPVLRIMALKLPLAAIGSVQQAYVTRHLLFQKFFLATLVGTIISGVIGIHMAYRGFGVWALAAQYLINSLCDTVLLGITIQWHPRLRFSCQRLQVLFVFGWKILLSDLINTVYTELKSIVIGKYYRADQLAYYNRGMQIPHLFITNVGVALSSVLFPVMSRAQEDDLQLKAMVRKTIMAGTYIMFPIMTGLAAISKPLVRILLTDRWLPAVPFLQMACFSFSFDLWSDTNLQVIKAKGEGKAYLMLEIQKKSIAMAMLLLSIPFGIYVFTASSCLYSLAAVVLNASQNSRNIDYGFCRQLADVFPNLCLSCCMGLAVLTIGKLPLPPSAVMSLQIAGGIILYLLLSFLTKNKSLIDLCSAVNEHINKEGQNG